MNKRTLIRMAMALISMFLFAYGFQEGMEWYRVGSVMLGGLILGRLSVSK